MTFLLHWILLNLSSWRNLGTVTGNYNCNYNALITVIYVYVIFLSMNTFLFLFSYLHSVRCAFLPERYGPFISIAQDEKEIRIDSESGVWLWRSRKEFVQNA